MSKKTEFAAYRNLCGKTQKDIAERFNCTVSLVKKWESEKYNVQPSDESLDYLKKEFKEQAEFSLRDIFNTRHTIENVGGPIGIIWSNEKKQMQYDLVVAFAFHVMNIPFEFISVKELSENKGENHA